MGHQDSMTASSGKHECVQQMSLYFAFSIFLLLYLQLEMLLWHLRGGWRVTKILMINILPRIFTSQFTAIWIFVFAISCFSILISPENEILIPHGTGNKGYLSFVCVRQVNCCTCQGHEIKSSGILSLRFLL